MVHICPNPVGSVSVTNELVNHTIELLSPTFCFRRNASHTENCQVLGPRVCAANFGNEALDSLIREAIHEEWLGFLLVAIAN
jgi:hypothetical protein